MKKTKQGQSFFDKVTQFTGNFENAFEIELLNEESLTDDLTIGQLLKYGIVTDEEVVSFFNKLNEPATAIKMETFAEAENDGIGYMIIESTFIVR